MQVFKSAIPHTASISPFLCLLGLHYQITPCTPRDSQRYVCCGYMPSRSISAFSFGGASRSVWSSAKLQSPACLISNNEGCRRCRCGRVDTAVFRFRGSSSLYLRFEPEDLEDHQYRRHSLENDLYLHAYPTCNTSKLRVVLGFSRCALESFVTGNLAALAHFLLTRW